MFDRTLASWIATLALLPASIAFGQQTYVGRYDVYTGYTYINAPYLGLGEQGFHTQFGFRPSYYYSLGFDYSVATDDNTLGPNVMTNTLQQELGAQLGQLAAMGAIPANYKLAVPVHMRTQTFTIGPQLAYRHFKAATLFIRPNLGAMQAVATPRPTDPIQTAVVAQLTPSGQKTDWTYYWGVGGGVDLNVSKHFAIRVQADFVHENLYDDILRNGFNIVRFSIGPGFQFGKNVSE